MAEVTYVIMNVEEAVGELSSDKIYERIIDTCFLTSQSL